MALTTLLGLLTLLALGVHATAVNVNKVTQGTCEFCQARGGY